MDRECSREAAEAFDAAVDNALTLEILDMSIGRGYRCGHSEIIVPEHRAWGA